MSKTPCELIIDARWVLPVAPADTLLEEASVAVDGGRICDVGPREAVHAAVLAPAMARGGAAWWGFLPVLLCLPALCATAYGHPGAAQRPQRSGSIREFLGMASAF